MKYRSMCYALALSLAGSTFSLAQQDPLALYEGVWVSSATGAQFIFTKVGADRVVGLPTFGPGILRVSNGDRGSNIRVSGEGFDCYYLASRINRTTMTWELKGVTAGCPAPGRLERVGDDTPTPTPPPSQTPSTQQQQQQQQQPQRMPPRSSWSHNGSTMTVVTQGSRLTIYYAQPRQGMVNEGVRSGTVLFEGSRNSNSLSGTSYVFDRRCRQIPYSDDGEVSNGDRQILLHGRLVPTQLGADCGVLGHRTDPSVFYRTD